MRKTQNSTAPLIEAFASLSRKAAGSQGRALSRPSQRAESPFDSRCPTRESIKQKTIALRRARNTLCAPGALMEGTVLWGRFPLYRHFVFSARSCGVRMYFVPHRTSSRTGDEVANQSGRLVCMSGLWPQGRCGAAAALFYSFLVDSGQRPESRGEFRILRDVTQGSALRTRKPLKRFDPNFISPAGGRGALRPARGTKSICGNHRQKLQSFD